MLNTDAHNPLAERRLAAADFVTMNMAQGDEGAWGTWFCFVRLWGLGAVRARPLSRTADFRRAQLQLLVCVCCQPPAASLTMCHALLCPPFPQAWSQCCR
jgi:hypothetical protein